MIYKKSSWLFLLTVALLIGFFAIIYPQKKLPTLPAASKILSEDVQASSFMLWNLSLGGKGSVYGSRGNRLFKIIDGGQAIKEIHVFENAISAIHERTDGLIIVATDDGRWSADKPCRLYRSFDSGKTFEQIKQIDDGGTALWWSIASDQAGRLFVAEYGPQAKGMSKTLWRSDNDGENWQAIYTAADKDQTHLHRIAVDPFTDDLWLSQGDGKNRAMLQSIDHGESWHKIAKLQATAVAFDAQAIYWGKDEKNKAGILRYDRKDKTFKMIFKAADRGNYGGSIYDMVLLQSGELIAPFMKYANQNHVAAVWRGRGDDWRPIFQLASKQGVGAAMETIAGPDTHGWVYFTGYQIKIN